MNHSSKSLKSSSEGRPSSSPEPQKKAKRLREEESSSQSPTLESKSHSKKASRNSRTKQSKEEESSNQSPTLESKSHSKRMSKNSSRKKKTKQLKEKESSSQSPTSESKSHSKRTSKNSSRKKSRNTSPFSEPQRQSSSQSTSYRNQSPVFVLNLDSLKIASETKSFHKTFRRSSEKKVATKKVPRYIEVDSFAEQEQVRYLLECIRQVDKGKHKKQDPDDMIILQGFFNNILDNAKSNKKSSSKKTVHVGCNKGHEYVSSELDTDDKPNVQNVHRRVKYLHVADLSKSLHDGLRVSNLVDLSKNLHEGLCKRARRAKMIEHLQRVSDSIVTKFNKSEIDPILLENAYYSPEESEEDPDDSTDNNRITVKDLRQGVGPIVPLSGTATGASHVVILQKYVIPTMRRTFPNGDGKFQEDNARPHTSKVAKKFYTENDL
ncbi:hypothetical protein C1646_768716 [Rhizophagus diaphanus]|nr:hypothetical protein C1646_768716 [Rhizophagus diaphanus] [Rhizophagus sp. MUCL 43196]